MGWILRKSIRLGPVRLNLSRSGIGVSAGVTGARIGAGPRGAHFQVGRGGVYYRQRLGVAGKDASGSKQASSEAVALLSGADLSPETQDDALRAINARIRRGGKSTAVFAVTLLAAALALWFLFRATPAIAAPVSLTVLGIGGIASVATWRRDQAQRVTRLTYGPNELAESIFRALSETGSLLAQSKRVWCVERAERTEDWKRHGGADTLLDRHRVTVSITPPPYLSLDVQTWCIATKRLQLFFLPDRLYVYRSGTYVAIPYGDLEVAVVEERYGEDEELPSDAEVLGTTWMRVNKDGSPDRRFAANRQFPIARYALIGLHSSSGLTVFLQVSNYRIGLGVGEGLAELARITANVGMTTGPRVPSQQLLGDPAPAPIAPADIARDERVVRSNKATFGG